MELIYDHTISASEVLSLIRSVGWDPHNTRTVEKTQAQLDRSYFKVGAIEDGKLVGFVRVCGDPYIVQILDLIVLADYRRRGIGTKLMEAVIQHLEHADYVSVTLTDGTRIKTFYEKFGFQKFATDTPSMVYRPN